MNSGANMDMISNDTLDDCNITSAGRLPKPEPFSGWVLAMIGIPASIIIMIVVVGNALVLLMKVPAMGQRQTMLLVCNLALADLLVGLVVLPLSVGNLLAREWAFGHLMCRIWVSCDVIFCTASIVTICVISVDRYVAVTRPLRYMAVVTRRKVLTANAVIWVSSTAVLLGTLRWEQTACSQENQCFAGNEVRYLTHSVMFAFFLPAAVTLTLYWKIYKLAKCRQRAIGQGMVMLFGKNLNLLTGTLATAMPLRIHRGGGENAENGGVRDGEGVIQHQQRVLKTHQRLAKTLGLVSCAFLFCWLPFFSLYLTNAQCDCIPVQLVEAASWLGYCNSMINPIIYAFNVAEFKAILATVFRPCFKPLGDACPTLSRFVSSSRRWRNAKSVRREKIIRSVQMSAEIDRLTSLGATQRRAQSTVLSPNTLDRACTTINNGTLKRPFRSQATLCLPHTGSGLSVQHLNSGEHECPQQTSADACSGGNKRVVLVTTTGVSSLTARCQFRKLRSDK